MDLHLLFDRAASVMTVVSFLTFMGIVYWAWARSNQPRFAEASQLPFVDGED